MKLMRQIKTTSDNHEDEFAHRILTDEDEGFKGTFLDVGCGNGRHGNNTYTLEEAGWQGTLVDSSREMMEHNSRFRASKLAVADLVTIDWCDMLQVKKGEAIVVDYISFNVNDNIIECVRNFPWSSVRFRVLTLKHNEFKIGPATKEEARRILTAAGYLLLAGDVCNDTLHRSFADWYVDPRTIPPAIYQRYISYGLRGIEVIYKPKVASAEKFVTNSADLQDEFAARLLGKSGRFLDVGCGNGGVMGNNTLMLERLGWTGIMVDIDAEAYRWNMGNRKAKAICADVTTCDWSSVLGKKPEEMVLYDYISFDVDEATVAAVKHFPWSSVRFRLITIEHDAYRFGDSARTLIRDTMSKHGYILLAGNVCADFLYQPYEDWFIDPLTVSPLTFLPYVSNGLRAAEVIYTPRT